MVNKRISGKGFIEHGMKDEFKKSFEENLFEYKKLTMSDLVEALKDFKTQPKQPCIYTNDPRLIAQINKAFEEYINEKYGKEDGYTQEYEDGIGSINPGELIIQNEMTIEERYMEALTKLESIVNNHSSNAYINGKYFVSNEQVEINILDDEIKSYTGKGDTLLEAIEEVIKLYEDGKS